MIAFQVNDMTCGHCVSVITKALKDADNAAKVTIDLEHHMVSVIPAEATIDDIRDAIIDAGYTPQQAST
jgi:copper chaperone